MQTHHMTRSWITCFLFLMTTAQAPAVAPTADELLEARRWTAARFLSGPQVKEPQAGLIVVANNDPMQKDARNGKPLRIGDRKFQGGLFCHAVSKVIVRLPGPGKTFSAVVGVDSNFQTIPGRGSIVFSVILAGKRVYQSPLMREGMPAIPVTVDLGGAREFVLEVGDGGDGIGCDQADWAEARVVLADGRTLPLAELPVLQPRQSQPTTLPFSFLYGGKPGLELLKAWRLTRESRRLDDGRTQHILTWHEPGPGLVVRCVAVEYSDFPTVEWTLYFHNAGTKDTSILTNIQVLDLGIDRFPWPASDWAEFRLHHWVGSPCAPIDYQPLETLLRPSMVKKISAAGGRPTNSDLPYFNLELPSSEGLILAVGWPGQWAAEFARDGGHRLHVRAGQEVVHCKLLPGEEIRTPLAVVQFWKGDWVRAQNVWRRWMLAHNLPRPGSRLPPVQLAACSSHQFGEMIHANSASQKLFIDRYLQEGLKLDYWWMDAGWYWNKTGWPHTGTWEVDTNRFPGGLRPICDHAHAKGVKIIVWFEPERVAADTWLSNHHPEWILGGRGGGLLNLGHPQARKWLTDHVDRLLTEQGIDLYRQDFNIDPLSFWRKNDSDDRQGITENKHVVGYLAYWDELRRRHPNMLIDSCASGGRRNDLETLRRAVPLLRSDYIMEPVGNQGHTYGISFWMPYYGTGTGSGAINPYLLRSVMCPHFTACFDVRRQDLDYNMIRRVMGQWRNFAGLYFGDYWPLTPYTLEETAWIGWQFDCPERGEGLVQAFRRTESFYEAGRFQLRGLDPEARYTLTNLDRPGAATASGRELMDRGLLISTTERPAAVIITYKKERPSSQRAREKG